MKSDPEILLQENNEIDIEKNDLPISKENMTNLTSFGTDMTLITRRPTRTSTSIISGMNIKSNVSLSHIDLFEAKENSVSIYKEVILKIRENIIFKTMSVLFILWALFADDFRIIWVEKENDVYFDIGTFICIGFFCIEIIINSIVEKKYLWSFFFFLDLLATLTLILDINYIRILIQGTKSNAISKTGRITRLVTRANRIIRLLKFLQLFGQKLHDKLIKKHPKGRKERNSIKRSLNHVEKPINIYMEDINKKLKEVEEQKIKANTPRIGFKLIKVTTNRILTMVLLLFVICPIFQSDFFFNSEKGYVIGLEIISEMSKNESLNVIESTIKNYVENEKKTDYPLIFLNTPSYPLASFDKDFYLYREDEFDWISIKIEEYNDPFEAAISLRFYTINNAIINIVRTIFACFILLISTIYITGDADRLVIQPLTRLIQSVKKLADDPLIFIKNKEKFTNEILDTDFLENSIKKIGMLLALGYGEAGTEVIWTSISSIDNLELFNSGNKQIAIFGFCDIRRFTDVTEVLQEEVLIFVNTIGEIVHKTVDKYGGSANKNIGDAFLLVWKAGLKKENPNEKEINRHFKALADCSVISFMKIMIALRKKAKILKYSKNSQILNRIPNYTVKMGFGLHFGWAIEGAIGSPFKIDSSYLSPNVNMAARLEAATKQYGVELLISENVYEICSKQMKRIFRELDNVTVKGSITPIRLFTIDLDYANLNLDEQKIQKNFINLEISMNASRKLINLNKSVNNESIFDDNINIDVASKKSIKKDSHLRKKKLIDEIIKGQQNFSKINIFLTTDEELRRVLYIKNEEFSQTFKNAITSYYNGEWEKAAKEFNQALIFKKDDGPSLTLRKYILSFQDKSPANWKGYRELLEK